MATLSSILIGTYSRLGQLTVGTATGGSVTTIVDSKLGGADNDWNNGAAFVIYDAGGAGAAPEGEMKIISDYTATTGTVDVASAWSGSTSVATGDTYGITTPEYPLQQVIRAVNEGLRTLGPMPMVDTTTLDAASQQTEYAYALAWKRNPPRSVWYQGRTGDANDNQWVKINRGPGGWDLVPAAAGSTGLLVLPQLASGRDIRIIYDGLHPTVSLYNDVVNELIDQDLAISVAVYQALLWSNSRDGSTDRGKVQALNNAGVERENAMARWPIWRPRRDRKILTIDWDRFDLPEEDFFDYPDPP